MTTQEPRHPIHHWGALPRHLTRRDPQFVEGIIHSELPITHSVPDTSFHTHPLGAGTSPGPT